MLVRLKELATQGASANAESNLAKIDAERAKLISEIDKIAASTEYADSKLINGTYGVSVSSTGSNVVDSYGYESISGMKAGHTYVINVVSTASSVADIRMEEWDSTDGTLNASQEVYDQAIPGSGSTSAIEFGALGVTLTVNDNLNDALVEGANDLIVASTGGSSTFQLGAETDSSNRIDVTLGSLTTTSLGIDSISLATGSGALSAMTLIDTAIGTLNTVTGNIGAASNQLMYHSANLATVVENVQAAESVIRDVDMAAEMVDFTKNQILLQAGTAMLAQANMAPQQVLALFG
jgi:flagellin